ncbi:MULTISPECIES: hypothetical protein [Delftia]|uniref:hypothetical protein n=1 Tax=Delftia TaxID=80865 RepID=UPI0000E989D5|nr:MULTISPECIES: hypothetical protein [Delftia]MCP4017008.1 hypothetical protein [Delftia sp.]MCP4534602.1 hypothetical protein [Delftia sp.]QPS76552.1 hypothetical protein I6G48_08355 [Delftia acidovorans]
MSVPLCCVVLPENLSNGFKKIEGLLSGLNILKENPFSRTIFYFDVSGKRLEGNLSDFNEYFESGLINGVQFWIDESCDVYVGWKECDYGAEFEFYLNGLDDDDVFSILSELTKFIWINYRASYNEGRFFSIGII